jgi:hypothetical protein
MADAIKPNFFSQFPSLKQDEEAKKRGVTDEERLFYGMYNTAGWKLFSQLAHRLMDELDSSNDQAIASGAPIEEIGKNAVVISLTKGVIKQLLNKVEDCREACEQPTTS